MKYVFTFIWKISEIDVHILVLLTFEGFRPTDRNAKEKMQRDAAFLWGGGKYQIEPMTSIYELT